jgi:hypothetical protein
MSMLHGAVTAGPSGPVIVLAGEADLTTAATPWADSSASGSWRVSLVMFGPSGSGRAVGGAAGPGVATEQTRA